MNKNNKKTQGSNKELVKAARIRLDASQIKELADKFKCTPQMVRNACRYTSLTPFSDEIRLGAKELLINEANKI